MPYLPRRLVCEALGTALLLAAVVGSGIMAQRLSGGNNALALLCNTLPTGAMLTVLILVFGPLSGAHFNPAVSIAFALRQELPWTNAAAYIAAQMAGGLVGALRIEIAAGDIDADLDLRAAPIGNVHDGLRRAARKPVQVALRAGSDHGVAVPHGPQRQQESRQRIATVEDCEHLSPFQKKMCLGEDRSHESRRPAA